MTHNDAHTRDAFTRELDNLRRQLKDGGLGKTEIQVIINLAMSRGTVSHRDVISSVTSATAFQTQKTRETAAGGADNLTAIEEAFGTGLSVSDLETIEPRVTGFASELGTDDLAGTLTRFANEGDDAGGRTRGDFASVVGGSFQDEPELGGPGGGVPGTQGFSAGRTNVGEINGQQVEVADDGTTWLSGNIITGAQRDSVLSEIRAQAAAAQPGEEDRVRRDFVGRNDAGQRVETNSFGDVWLDGIQIPTGSQAANNALNQAFDNGGATQGTGTGRAVNLQSLGTDFEGFAVIFNPATGAITRGPQVGFAEIDPRETAAEASRRFNEQQQLREGEFVRDVLSGGRNFVTAALLTRGGQRREGQATQADIIRGGLGVSSLADAVGLGLDGPAAGGGGIPTTETTPITSPATGLAGAAAADTGLAAALGPLTGGTAGLATDAQISPDGFTGEPLDDLGAFARAEAPPAIRSIIEGQEVGLLSTPGSIPLASPTSLANLSRAEQGALDTTLQLSDQRTLDEFRLESEQRFRPGGFRGATRA